MIALDHIGDDATTKVVSVRSAWDAVKDELLKLGTFASLAGFQSCAGMTFYMVSQPVAALEWAAAATISSVAVAKSAYRIKNALKGIPAPKP